MCVMAAYILAFIVETREYSFLTTPNRGRYTPWPGFAWITGTISGALWVVAGSAAFCAPPRACDFCTGGSVGVSPCNVLRKRVPLVCSALANSACAGLARPDEVGWPLGACTGK